MGIRPITALRRVSLRIAVTVALVAASAPRPARAHLATYDDIWRSVLSPVCNNCHGPLGGAQSGGMIVPDDDTNTERSWWNALVGVPPTNGAAQSLGKLRVTPYQPWNSLLLDKLSAHLKSGEGRPMPFGSNGYAHSCPGAIEKITKWILDGAPYAGYVAGDTVIGTVNCDTLAEPAFVAPGAPAGGAQLLGDPFNVAGTTSGRGDPREGEQVSTRTLAAGVAVGRIEIVASKGTEYVVVTRGNDAAPLAVARGDSLDLQLPAGVAVPLSAGDTITIRQRIRNDYWVKAGTGLYANSTDGNVAVNFYPAASADHVAAPFIDTTGTRALFVPPRLAGETGGVWSSPSAVAGAVVGVWGDGHVIEAAIVDPAGQKVAMMSSDPVTTGYITLADATRPAGVLAYQCTHSNGFTTTTSNSTYGTEQYEASLSLLPTTSPVNRPMKFGCLETAALVPMLPPPAGTPLILGQAAATDCARSIHDPAQSTPYGPAYDDSECTDATVDSCAPANLVGGAGVNDGRCSLIGLAW